MRFHRVEADYAAESAAFGALARLTECPNWRPVEETISLASGAAGAELGATVSVRARGLLLELAATATRGSRRPVSSAAMLVTGWFDERALPAIAFGDTLLSLTLAAGASVRGPIRSGPRGIETALLNGRPFTGLIEGNAALYAVRLLGQLAYGEPGMGWGDVKLAAALGALMGWDALWALYLAAVLGAAVGVAGRAIERTGRLQRVPFDPFVASGALAAALFGVDDVWEVIGSLSWT